jgi:hypothetical protein
VPHQFAHVQIPCRIHRGGCPRPVTAVWAGRHSSERSLSLAAVAEAGAGPDAPWSLLTRLIRAGVREPCFVDSGVGRASLERLITEPVLGRGGRGWRRSLHDAPWSLLPRLIRAGVREPCDVGLPHRVSSTTEMGTFSLPHVLSIMIRAHIIIPCVLPQCTPESVGILRAVLEALLAHVSESLCRAIASCS